MNPDPLGPIVEALQSAIQQYRRDAERTRAGWDDETRRQFDARHGRVIDDEMRRALRSVEMARNGLRDALVVALSGSR